MEKERKSKLAEKFTTYLFYASVLVFLVAFNFQDSRTGGWNLQIIPNLNGTEIKDVTLTDSLTGYMATGLNNTLGYILKTTNGGTNWIIKKTNIYNFQRIIFCDKNIGYCNSFDTLFKTTDAGENWISIHFPGIYGDDMYALNKDTLWIAMNEGLTGGLFRSTNGGLNWTNQFYQYNNNPDKIYMYNKNFGFMRRYQNYIGRTTNGGYNWSITNEDSTFFDIYFKDTLTGWRSYQNIYKTTDGGFNWISQTLPRTNSSWNIILKFSHLNKDTLFGVGGSFDYPNGSSWGIVYKTTNGGTNWGYQIPDTNFAIYQYTNINFIDKLRGWAFRWSDKAVHTITGGSDTTFYTNIREQKANFSSDYELKQNFPNPFNPETKIKYSIKNSKFRIQNSELKIIVYNILGKKVTILINEKKAPGTFAVKFNGENLSSGIYFYSLFADGIRMDTKKMILLK